MKTDGSGNLDWASAASGGVDAANGASDRIATFTDSDSLNGEATLTFADDVLTATSTSANLPKIELKNTHAGATAGILQFSKDTASGDDSDTMGTISFFGTDAGENTHEELAKIEGIVETATAGQEGGQLKFSVASHDASLVQGLLIEDGDASGEVDVTLAAGAASVTTVSGGMTVGGGYGSTGATISSAGVGQFNGALTTDGALTAGATTMGGDSSVSNGYGFTVGAAAGDRQAVNGVVCETQILGTGDADSAFAIGRWGANASSALLYMYKSRGGSIGGAGTVLNDNDRIGQIIFCGDDSTDYQVAAGRMWCEVDVGTVSENVLGGAVCISTNDGGSGSGDTERFRIHANGNFTGSSSADISDSRLKENVATLSGSLAKINQLRGIEFTWKAEAKKDTDKHYGFLAQEVESIIPTVVWDKSVHDITAQAATTYTDGDTIPDGKSIGDVKTAAIEGKAFKSLHYSGLIPVLVEAIKELTARVEALEA